MERANDGTVDASLGDNIDGVVEVNSWLLDHGGDLAASAVAIDNTGAICAAAMLTSGAEWWVSYIITRPDWRGRGVGTAVTAEAFVAAMERGATEVNAGVTDGNVASTRLLRSLGFTRVGPVDW
jgi:ribosomal protein S18 acetylase RimI-like enzyme